MIRPLKSVPIRELAERLCGLAGDFRDGIHPADEMYGYNLELLGGDSDAAALLYFAKGAQVAAVTRALGEAAWGDDWPEVSLLDFASGFGRATRFVLPTKAPGTFLVSDIVAEAMDFQRSCFGVGTVLSTADPVDLDLDLDRDRRFGLVQVSSLFSHLPEATFGAWLEKLWSSVDGGAGVDDGSSVEGGGVLAISTLDPSLLEGELPPEARTAEDFVFQPASESRVLDPESYGTSYAGEGFVRRIAAARLGPEVGLRRIPRGLCGHQDLYLLSRRPDLDALASAVPRFPNGMIETVLELGPGQLDAGGVELAGWARSTRDGGRISEVRLRIAGRPDGDRVAEGPTPDDDRWRLHLDPREVGLDTLMAVTAHDGDGPSSVIGVGRLRPFLGS